MDRAHRSAQRSVLLAFIVSTALCARAENPPDFISEKDDVVYHYFTANRYFAVIAVDKYSVPGADLPFAAVDAVDVTNLLTALGYKQLAPPLSGEAARLDGLQQLLRAPASLTPDTELLVYYSGHSVISVDGSNLWLQLNGQHSFAPGLGMSIRDLFERIRNTSGFDGSLSVLLDTCFSGATAQTKMSLSEFGRTTVVFTSSDSKETSHPVDLPKVGKAKSAFTYSIAEGVQSHWDEIDDNGDGFITYAELDVYISNQLAKLYSDKQIPEPMHPQEYGDGVRVFAYDRSKVKTGKWNSAIRAFLRNKLVAIQLALNEMPIDAAGPSPLTLRVAWQQTLKDLVAAPGATSYTRAASSLVAGQFESALAALDALKPDPTLDSEFIRIARGYALSCLGRYRDAESVFEAAANADVTALPRQDIVIKAATTAALSHDYDRSSQLFQAAQRAAPENSRIAAQAARGAASIYETRGDRDKAIQFYNKAINQFALTNANVAAAATQADLARLYEEKGNVTIAKSLFKASIEAREQAGVSDWRLIADMDRYASVLALTNKKNDIELDAVQERVEQLRERLALEHENPKKEP